MKSLYNRRVNDGDAAGVPQTIRRLAIVASAVAFALTLERLRQTWHYFTMDDAYTFYRYAMNFRHGAGISWNPQGPHTYGATSLMWLAVVLCFSFLPVSPAHAILLASWAAGIVALGAIAVVISRQAKSSYLRSFWIVLATVALPLCLNGYFLMDLANGMETMLAMFCNALFVGAVWVFLKNPRPRQALVLAFLAFAAYLSRPESALCTAITVLLAGIYLRRRKPVPAVAAYFAGFALMVAAALLGCARYFGTPVPLGFYAKLSHAYAGYLIYWCWPCYVCVFLGMCTIYLVLLGLFASRDQIKVLFVFIVPVICTFAYLATVNQIMGSAARYYLPYLPYLIVPAFLICDRALADRGLSSFRLTPWRIIAVMAAAVLTSSAVLMPRGLQLSVDLAHTVGYRRPVVTTAAKCPLPVLTWWPALNAFSSKVAAHLPPGSLIYASEVGMPGAVAPRVTVIDLAGLHDTSIARHGLDMDAVLNNRPDLIWLPHYDYTHMFGVMLSDPRLLQQYDVIAGAFDYGIAVRKSSPHHDEIMELVAQAWPELYPGTSMNDYFVSAVQWDSSAVVMKQNLVQ